MAGIQKQMVEIQVCTLHSHDICPSRFAVTVTSPCFLSVSSLLNLHALSSIIDAVPPSPARKCHRNKSESNLTNKSNRAAICQQRPRRERASLLELTRIPVTIRHVLNIHETNFFGGSMVSYLNIIFN